jgi:hypothetical protein
MFFNEFLEGLIIVLLHEADLVYRPVIYFGSAGGWQLPPPAPTHSPPLGGCVRAGGCNIYSGLLAGDVIKLRDRLEPGAKEALHARGLKIALEQCTRTLLQQDSCLACVYMWLEMMLQVAILCDLYA